MFRARTCWPARYRAGNRRRSGRDRRRARRGVGTAARQFFLRDVAAANETVHEHREPPLVVGHAQVLSGGNLLELEAEISPDSAAVGTCRAVHRPDASLPRFTED